MDRDDENNCKADFWEIVKRTRELTFETLRNQEGWLLRSCNNYRVDFCALYVWDVCHVLLWPVTTIEFVSVCPVSHGRRALGVPVAAAWVWLRRCVRWMPASICTASLLWQLGPSVFSNWHVVIYRYSCTIQNDQCHTEWRVYELHLYCGRLASLWIQSGLNVY